MTIPAPINYQSPITTHASPFLRACHRLPVDFTPVWFMRQVERYMVKYRAIREKLVILPNSPPK